MEFWSATCREILCNMINQALQAVKYLIISPMMPILIFSIGVCCVLSKAKFHNTLICMQQLFLRQASGVLGFMTFLT